MEGSDAIIVYYFKDLALDACKRKAEYFGCGIAGILRCLGMYYRDNISVITSRKYLLPIILEFLKIRLKRLPA